MNKRVLSRVPSIVALIAAMLSTIMSGQGMSGQGHQRFTGVITDSMCDAGDHAAMRMGPTDAECTVACVEDHGASYVLYDGKEAYFLSDQKTPEKFAGKRVVVTGTLDTAKKILAVETISLAASKD